MVVAVLLIVGAFPLSAAAQRRADLTGVYGCTETAPDGTDHHGVVMISRRGDAFQVQWRIPSAPVTIGPGVVTGDVIAVNYFGSNRRPMVLPRNCPGRSHATFQPTVEAASYRHRRCGCAIYRTSIERRDERLRIQP
jgi:hypothetical protein